jgi:2-succinyl-5-enolpyruvyl-6-hydroxy-3-cyclohexene-1-carboxylate synthase
VRHACTSPGSRSAPIVLALARERRLRTASHIDERCAGFFALGCAKATGSPAVVTCTSGTATANLVPPVFEAHEAGVPLLVLTADRPPELREVGAGQTIDQLKLYGDAVRWFVEVGVDEATPERVRWMRALACRATWAALGAGGGRPGPVHLNLPLREPLVPPRRLEPDLQPGRPGGRPWLARTVPIPASRPLPLGEGAARGVVVAGRWERSDLGAVVAPFAQHLGWPLLADPLSGARRGDAAVAHYDALLRDRAFAAAHAPELVLRVGDLPTSKPLRAWLADLPGARQLALRPAGVWHDPEGVLEALVDEDPVSALGVPPRLPPAEPAWLAGWRAADERAAGATDAALGDGLSEPRVARELAARLPGAATLVVASSMPVRDLESFAGVRDDPPRVLANRGANGIDGTVSTAYGVARASDGPVVLLIGDVALLHDLGGLLAARRLAIPLVVVVLDNDGGGIFEFLPIAGEADAFEAHVATPHGVDLAHAAALFGLGHERPADLPAFRAALDRSLRAAGTTLIEVASHRRENAELHRRVWRAVADGLEPPRSA